MDSILFQIHMHARLELSSPMRWSLTRFIIDNPIVHSLLRIDPLHGRVEDSPKPAIETEAMA